MIVGQRVLTGERESGRGGIPDTQNLKDLPILVEAFESVVEVIQCELCEHACPGDITEVEVGVEAPNDFSGDKTFDCRYPYLE